MRKTPRNFVDVTGQKFNHWTVLERVENRHKRVHYMCRCRCGFIAVVSKTALANGTSKCCGCSKSVNSKFNRSRPKCGKRYSDPDELLIKLWYPKTGTKLLVEFLGRSREAIRHKAFTMGIECELEAEDYRYRPDIWSEREEQVLLDNYPKGGTEACLPLLPNRTKNAIWNHVRKLKLLKVKLNGRTKSSDRNSKSSGDISIAA